MRRRLGACLGKLTDGPFEDRVDPSSFAEATLVEPDPWSARRELRGRPRRPYHRGRRLAEAAVAAVEPRRAAQQADLDAATAVKEFTAWLQEHRADQPDPSDQPEEIDLAVLVEELADSWCFGEPAAIKHTCSPHRVALTVLHLLNYYRADFAAKLIALLPDWTSWLAMRNGTAPELAERCRPYALGEPHADVGSDHIRPNYLARVIE
ncbi:MAG TPA: hypothetical protein VFM54_05580 [Micromonosporaceae bacterium]|nr:hypothetical protein [Micromonosporaceae bacterium]